MKRVGVWLARGIVVAAALLTGGRLGDPTPSGAARAVALVRSQDFTPIFDMAGRRIDAYFDPRKTDQLIEDLFSLSGKWKAVTRGRESYERHVRKVFEERVCSAEGFDSVLRQIRGDYDFGLRAAENRLLVALYDDVRPSRPELTFEAFRAEYRDLSAVLGPDVLRDLGMNLISFVGSDAAAVLFVAALSSTGILGTSVAAGATGSPLTFGLSLAAGLIAGIALDALVGDAYEDAARMEVRRQVNALRNKALDDVHAALVKALLAYRTLQERCVVQLYEGGFHERLSHRP
ncbi:MAG TPA: hypothetical protein VMU54_06855 [Planctomycetota bacterium]|nr:hypothetical protein [Planctomycetota bacterium]